MSAFNTAEITKAQGAQAGEKPAGPLDAASAQTRSGFTSWLCLTLCLILLGSAALVVVNVRLDAFGLFGRKNVKVYTLERYSKYLMSYRFIPDNFDGVLLSNSVAANWDTAAIHSGKVFNCAIYGSNITEQKLVADNVLQRGHLRTAIVVLYPTLTATHGPKTAYMSPHDYWASFGSIQTAIVFTQQALNKVAAATGRHFLEHQAAPYGAYFHRIGRDPNPVAPLTAEEMQVDPVAVGELNELITKLHAKRVKIYAVLAPIYKPKWAMQGRAFTEWNNRTLKLFLPDDTVIDLNDGELDSVLVKRENFPDYIHLTPAASRTVMESLAHRIDSYQSRRTAAIARPAMAATGPFSM